MKDVTQMTIEKWENRPQAPEYVTIFIEPTFAKLHRRGVRNEPAYISMGVLPNGERKVLGFMQFGLKERVRGLDRVFIEIVTKRCSKS